jgi:type II secretory pathway pseudopilin PulG
MRPSPPPRRPRGFTYIGLLFAIAFIGLLLAGAGEVWQTTAQREREEQLLFVGREFGRALASYRAASPVEPKQWPRRLEDLVEDRRSLVTRRHLRRIREDPMTGKAEWGLIKSGEFIVGVHSLGAGKPLKTANFLPEEESFAGAASHGDWRFFPPPEAAPQAR